MFERAEERYRVRIGKTAAEIIRKDCRGAAERDLECGGALLGWFQENGVLVTHAVETGPNAQQGMAHLFTDSEYQNRRIDEICGSWSGRPLVYVGDWHRHPGRMNWPSSTDMATIGRILRDPDYRMPGEFAGIIATGGVDDVSLDAFRARPGQGGDTSARFDPAPLDIVEDVRDGALPAPPKAAIAAGAELRAALLALEREFGRAVRTASLDQGASIGTYRLDGARGPNDVTVSVIFPREFPLNAPLVVLGHLDNPLQLELVPDRLPWNSLRSMGEWIAKALETQPRVWRMERLMNRFRCALGRGRTLMGRVAR